MWKHSRRNVGHLVEYAMMRRWVVQGSPLLEETYHRRQQPVPLKWRMVKRTSEARLMAVARPCG